MKNGNQHLFYVPASGAQKFEFYVGTENALTVIRQENWFYQVEQDGQKKPLGGLISLLQYLHRCQAKFLDKHNKPRNLFYNRTVAKQMMREGYSVVDVVGGIIYCYTEDYSKIVSSSGLVMDNDLPPATIFCIDFTEAKLAKTYKEVMAERLFAKAQEEERLEKEKKERESEVRREAARKLFEKSRNTAENSKSIPQPGPVEDKSSHNPFLKFVGAAAIFLGGLGLGLLIKS